MTGVDEALQAGWPQGGAVGGVSCLGPHAPPPQNALEAALVSTETGRGAEW